MILELAFAAAVVALLRRGRRPREHEPRVIHLLPAPRPAVELTRREIRIARSRPACIACGRELGTVEALRALATMCIVCGRDRQACDRSGDLDPCRPVCRTCAGRYPHPVAMPTPGDGTPRS